MKWHKGAPDKPGTYIVQTLDGTVTTMKWCGCWDCTPDPITGEIYKFNQRFDVVAWREADE